MSLCSEGARSAIRLCSVALALSAAVLATPITPAAFSSNKVVESFEGISPGANVTRWAFLAPNDIWLEPGSVNSFLFSSGVRLTSPIPNLHAFSGNVLVGDYALNPGSGYLWSLTGNGNADASDVPTGTGYFGFNGDSSVVAEFTFPGLAVRVGAWITTDTAINSTATLRAYDRWGNFLEAVTISGVQHNLWRNNFFGLENQAGVGRIVIVGNGGILDDLTFDRMAPEMSTFTLALCGLALISLPRFRAFVNRLGR